MCRYLVLKLSYSGICFWKVPLEVEHQLVQVNDYKFANNTTRSQQRCLPGLL